MKDRDRAKLLERRRLLVASALAGLSAGGCDQLNPFKPCLSVAPVPSSSVGTPATPSGTTGADDRTTSDSQTAPPLPVAEPPGLTLHPLVAVYERDPWAMVLGADVPSFVLYADGEVITTPAKGDPPGRVRGRTSSATALAKQLFDLLEPEPVRRSLWGATDQPTSVFLVKGDRGWIQRTVYGMKAGCTPSSSRAAPVPAPVQRACSAIAALALSERRAWVPEAFEVMLWGFAHSREAPKPWPAGVPAPPAQKPPDKGVLKHRIGHAHHTALGEFLRTLGPGQAVSHAGYEWSVRTRALVPADEHLISVRNETWRKWAEQAGRTR